MSLPNASDLLLAIRLLADTSAATKNIQILEKELEKLGVKTDYAKRKLQEIGAVPVVPPAQVAGVKQLNTGLGEVAPHAEKATKGLWSLNNVARTALGTFTAMGVFLVTQFVGQAITKSIDSLKQLELAFYNIAVAESSLSKQGIDITPDDFLDIIKAVDELGLSISDIDIAKAVSKLGTGLRDLGLAKEQLQGLAEASAIIGFSKGISMDSVVDQFVLGIAKGGRGLADLDIQVDAAVIKQKALEEQLVASEDAWNNLTASQRQSIETQALYLIIMDNANERLEQLGMLEGSITEKSREMSRATEEASTALGILFGPVIKLGAEILTAFIRKGIDGINNLRTAYILAISTMATNFFMLREVLRGNITSLDEFKQVYLEIWAATQQAMTNYLIPSLPDDTPTGDLPDGGDDELLESQENIQKALEKMNNEILTAQLKLAQDMEDAQINLGRKLEDITIEYAKKRADAERDYANKVADIWASYHSKVADIRQSMENAAQEQRNRELENEEKFQEKMRQLKEDFLLNLEDALHARDARQVQRLIKQYELEKAQAEREHALEKKNNQRDYELRQERFRQDLEQAERERQEKLLAAQRDYQDKLAKLAADEQAERDAAELAYQRKMEDLEREMQNRLEIVAAKLVEEFNLTKEGLDAITALYLKYYRDVSQIYAAMQHMMAGMGNIGMGNTKGSSGGRGGYRYAEGGSMLANRPTTVTFGEAGMELATFTPLGRQGQDVNKLFTNMSGGGATAGGGMMSLEVGLSPDLELRVVKNTLGQVATVLDKVRRSK